MQLSTLVKDPQKALQDIGRAVAIEAGLRGGGSVIGRLLMGYFAGLPPEAYSLEAAVCFVLMSILEIPTGIAADMVGRVRALKLGALFQVAALVAMAGSIIAYRMGLPAVMWTLLMIEAVTDAFCNTLMSGSREAFYQDVIEANTHHLPEAEAKHYRVKYLSLSEQYSRWISFFSAIGLVVLTIVLEKWNGTGFSVCLIMAGFWYFMAVNFDRTGKAHLPPDVIYPKEQLFGRLKLVLEKTWSFVRVGPMRSAELRLGLLGDCSAYFFAYLFVQYLMISVIRDSTAIVPEYGVAIILAMSGASQCGKLIRSFVLPKLVNRVSGPKIIIGSMAMIVVWAFSLSHFYAPVSTPIGVMHLFLLALPVDLLVGMISRPSMGLIQVNTPSEIRATLYSIVSGVVILIHGIYAAALGSMGLAAPTVKVFSQVTMGTGMFLLVATLISQALGSHVSEPSEARVGE